MSFLNLPHQKHLGIVLDSNFNISTYVDQKLCKRIVGLIRQLSISLRQNTLLTIYKSFVRFRNISYDKPNSEKFQNKLEEVQYRACLAITVANQRILGALTGPTFTNQKMLNN